MASSSKMSVALPPQVAEVVSQAVESGEYASSSEVVQEALREWKLRRPLSPPEHRQLRRLWDEGIASGRGRFGTIGDLKREARRRAKVAKS